MTPGDRMMASALGSWTRLAPFAGLDPAAFEAEELWRREDPGQVRIVLRMRGGAGQDLVFKRVFQPQDRGRWAEALDGQRRAVRALMRDPVHVPPAILAEDAETLSTVQDFVPGRTLQDHMLLRFDKPGARAQVLQRAGRFLAAFHGATAEGDKPFNPATMLDYIRALGRRALSGDLTLADPDLFAVLAEGLEAAAQTAAGQPVRVAAQHGDLHARNLIVSGKRATLIDFAQDRSAPVQYDMARLIVDLGARFSGDAAPEATCGLPAADLAALSDGYGRDLSQDACLAFLCRCRVLQDWAALPAVASQRSAFQQERLLQLQKTATRLAAA
ncbi:aminoglycoside phosphotransferase [Dinoroseobacter shibae DFL 12 = DSM 16493]|uniref:Aminoglycoside phosphotransferase n=1 Tax=Dinoroseobacter shibae (strain DSM 16493 / NCIMB 14021 / DFL 12) TaxID=398580 RepID=A8LMB5_DINSH|nr:aminoglycoside phosphotransferase family protein [Dinoroseobacter shibae]ABV92092.1 aminoglycoside phosphotransferase [Dinoroseobacter shibae DFL 12 = DSM 16493]URF47054.1 aminoglycoside phosphotransferase family protein [Dinoroseobacter shibae]URF51365.1 aminoglycoside phosphotransferase family protein [Dinoroseobacter shibae]